MVKVGALQRPPRHALDRRAPYLTDHFERVIEVNLARSGDALHAGWSPSAMEGLGPDDVEAMVGTVSSAVAAVLDWTNRNNRDLNLVVQATQSLCELALQLPPEPAPPSCRWSPA